MVNEWLGFEFSNNTVVSCLNSTLQAACFRTGEEVLLFYNLNSDNLWFDMGILVVIVISIRMLAFVGLLIHTIIRGYF